MILKHNYWWFKSVIKESVCDDIVNHAKKLKDQIAVTGDINENNLTEETVKDLKKTRDSNVVFLKDSWIYELIIPYIDLANKNAEWNFDIEGAEACQFTEYGVGEYYGWHYDMHTEHGKKIRKLSVTCNLSNPEDYEGGDLEFSIYNPDKKSNLFKCTQIKPRGSIVVFPSFVWHRVKPVTRGKRYSLVIWNQGDKFK